MRSFSQCLFLKIRTFEEKNGERPNYILMDLIGISILKGDYEQTIGEEADDSLKFMGIDIVPTDKVDGTVLVKKESA